MPQGAPRRAVNGYRWFRGFNDYDNWQASGVSGEGARSFYYPPKPQKCADCHMPLVPSNDPAAKNGMVKLAPLPGRQYRAPLRQRRRGAAEDDAAVPAGRRRCRWTSSGWCAAVRSTRRRTQVVSRRASDAASTFAVGEESMNFGAQQAFIARPADGRRTAGQGRRRGAAPASRCVSRSSSARARSATSSPAAPSTPSTSGSSSRRSTTRAARSFTAARSRTAARARWNPGAHFYRSLLLDERGNAINKRNAWSARSVAYVRLIPPGAADTVHYRLRIPDDVSGDDHAAGEGELPQVRVVEHAVGVRRRARPRRKGASITPSATTTSRCVFTGDTSKVSGEHEAHPRHPDHRDGDGRSHAAGRGEGRRRCRRRRRSWTSRCASAGTTTASGCCCRGI